VVGLGRQLDMAVVAEGVETEEQMKILIELGCTHLQGYLFGRAVSAQALVKPLSVLTPLDASQSAISSQR
jgi:EAL domain-containing protein (putative c-di-GMP-specific phosphodiesterase class I)